METFLVRVWSDDPEPESIDDVRELHGVVQQLGSPEPHPFRTGSELLVRLRAALQRGEERRPVGGRSE